MHGGNYKPVMQPIHVDALHPGQRPPKLGVRFYSICKPPGHPKGVVGCDARCKRSWMGCHPFHMSCGYIWTRSDNPGTQSIYWDAVHPSNTVPKLWGQIWQDLQNHHAILVVRVTEILKYV